jgi:hypothetical protein
VRYLLVFPGNHGLPCATRDLTLFIISCGLWLVGIHTTLLQIVNIILKARRKKTDIFRKDRKEVTSLG